LFSRDIKIDQFDIEKKHTNHEIEPEYMMLIESIPRPTCPTKHKTAFQVLLG
jgi:hypothetical protein